MLATIEPQCLDILTGSCKAVNPFPPFWLDNLKRKYFSPIKLPSDKVHIGKAK